ncbi:hypothetical protein TNCV_4070731 [Trichonephila clavipes]|nr:hypothetical protein TNCV_4070731 [Trichonephila clavipes]
MQASSSSFIPTPLAHTLIIKEMLTRGGRHHNLRNRMEDSDQDLCEIMGDEAHFWLNGYVNKQNCRIWSEAQVYVETPLHPEKLTVWCASWAGGILLQKR